MLNEVKAIEPQLKQILYGCLEHVQATKAALYLSISHDLNAKTYEIVTSYQYNAAGRRVVTANDDLVDRLAMKRAPLFVNSMQEEQRFAEMLFTQGNERLLAAPLFSRGRLVGFIDMRDKAGKKPFENADVRAAEKIADEMTSLLAKSNLFGLAPIKLSEDESAHAPNVVTPPRSQLSSDVAAAEARPANGGLSPKATRIIETARQQIARRQLAREGTTRVLNDSDLEAVRVLLPAVLAIPGAVLGAFSAMGHVNNPQIIVAMSVVTDAALAKLQAHLDAWLKRNQQTPLLMRPQVIYPFGAPMAPIGALGPTFSASLSVFAVEGLVLTVVFEQQPDAKAQRAMRVLLRQLEQTIEAATTATSGRNERMIIAERLLEPDFDKYPELVEHSREVAVITHRFAKALDLPPAQIDTVRLAALVHDVGLRLLDYEHLYRKANLTPAELRALSEHSVVGAAIVEPLLGPDVAQAVLRHHERVDGKGYPSRLSGQQIPLPARMLQIVDSWVAMTSPRSYQTPVGREVAVTRLREGAGTQFDADLVAQFLAHLDEIAS